MGSKRVLVVGGAGYIGAHVNAALADKGYETVVLDSLIYGHREHVVAGRFEQGDLADTALVEALLTRHEIAAVMHFAGFTYVGESVTDPEKYYRNNVANTIGLLGAMRRCGTRALVFSSTCAVYGAPSVIPIPEEHPHAPINPYGASKAMVERIIRDCAEAYGFRFAVLRYFNAAGADPAGRCGERHDPETHLIPLALQAALGAGPPLRLFGTDYDTPDGTCIRDYIHVSDLAEAHILAMEQILAEDRSVVYNLGNGNGVSVRQILDAVETVTGRPVPVTVTARRAGDPPALVGDARRAVRELGWKPRLAGIHDILATAWAWEQARLRAGNQHIQREA